jgi:hypothetical protein
LRKILLKCGGNLWEGIKGIRCWKNLVEKVTGKEIGFAHCLGRNIERVALFVNIRTKQLFICSLDALGVYIK